MNVAQKYSIDQLDKDGFFPTDERGIGEPFEPSEGQDALGITITSRFRRRNSSATQDTEDTDPAETSPPGFLVQTKLLFDRELKNVGRDVASLGTRFGTTIFLGVLVGIIFLDVGETDSSKASNLQSHFGALIMCLLMGMFGTAQPALLSFPSERPVFLREYSTNHYSVSSYFMSRLTMEAVVTGLQVLVSSIITYFMIGFQMDFGTFYLSTYVLAMGSTALAVLLGAALENPAMAQEMLPILFVPQMLFAGFFVLPELIPVWLRCKLQHWNHELFSASLLHSHTHSSFSGARYLCTLTYSLRIIMVAEFEDCDPSNPEANDNCNNLLDSVDADADETWWNWLVLVVLFLVFRLFALIVLRKKATKFY